MPRKKIGTPESRTAASDRDIGYKYRSPNPSRKKKKPPEQIVDIPSLEVSKPKPKRPPGRPRKRIGDARLHIDNAAEVLGSPTAPGALMSEREQIFLEKMVEDGMTGKDALVAAGYDVVPGRGAEKLAMDLLNKHERLNPEYVSALRDKITPEEVVRVISEAMDATKYIRTGRDEYIEVPDHSTRMAAVDQFREVIGLKSPKQTEVREMSIDQILIQIAIEDDREEVRR
jgi:hypothetical protein